MKYNLLDDLSLLSTIPVKIINNLTKTCQTILVEDIVENIYTEDTICEIDIGIGVLYVKYLDDNFSYIFKPSEDFNKELQECVKNNKKPLKELVSEKLSNNILKTYKELI